MATVAGIDGPMLRDTPTVSQLSHVIAQSIPPAFLLAALAGFIGFSLPASTGSSTERSH
jgi:hypothetical protein